MKKSRKVPTRLQVIGTLCFITSHSIKVDVAIPSRRNIDFGQITLTQSDKEADALKAIMLGAARLGRQR